MTTREAAIVSAYTGYLIGSFGEMHKYVEDIMGRPVWTHEMADVDVMDQIREKAKPDFVAMTVSDEGGAA
jgi:hypothetical protein